MIYAFDPGDMTGIAVFNDEAQLVELVTIPFEHSAKHPDGETLTEWLGRQEDVKTVVYERFILYKKSAPRMAGSKMKASQAIGAIKMWAKTHKAEIVEQPAGILSTASKMTQVKRPTVKEQSHAIEAFLHGAYYLIREGKMKTSLEREYEQKD